MIGRNNSAKDQKIMSSLRLCGQYQDFCNLNIIMRSPRRRHAKQCQEIRLLECSRQQVKLFEPYEQRYAVDHHGGVFLCALKAMKKRM